MKVCGKCHRNTLLDKVKIVLLRRNSLILSINKWDNICEDCYNTIKDDPKYKEVKKNMKWAYAQLRYISQRN